MHVRMTWLFGILMLLAVGCTSNESTDRASGPATMPAIDMAKLEQLVTRLFTQPSGFYSKYEGEPQILVGELPPDFGVRVPDGAIIFGSVVHRTI